MEHLFPPTDRTMTYQGTRALVPYQGPAVCPRCGQARVRSRSVQSALFRHGGHGADRVTRVTACSCYVATEHVETNPRKPEMAASALRASA